MVTVVAVVLFVVVHQPIGSSLFSLVMALLLGNEMNCGRMRRSVVGLKVPVCCCSSLQCMQHVTPPVRTVVRVVAA